MGAPMCRGRTRDAAVGGAKITVAPGRAVPAHARVFAVSQTIPRPPQVDGARRPDPRASNHLPVEYTDATCPQQGALFRATHPRWKRLDKKGGRHVSDSASD
jgi:hypothetical protein